MNIKTGKIVKISDHGNSELYAVLYIDRLIVLLWYLTEVVGVHRGH